MGLGFTAPLIAADNHMIKRPVKLDSGLACHGCESRKKEDIKSIHRDEKFISVCASC